MKQQLRLTNATRVDLNAIWAIILQAKAQMQREGRTQWTESYPTLELIMSDIDKGEGYILRLNDSIVAYAVLLFSGEHAYQSISGKWLSNSPYVVVHRLAVADSVKNQGIATHLFKEVEQLARERGLSSFKVDTNYDNVAMLKLLDRAGFSYCGEVTYPGEKVRMAFEKLLF